jgi:hypothetical protein
VSIFSKARDSRARLIIALVLTLLAGVSVYCYLVSARQTVPVIVAARDISPNTKITNSDVETENININSKHQLAFSDTKQVVGSMTKETIHQDMQVISSQIGENNNSLKPGETLLPLSDVKISPGLKTGNIVNIVVTRPEGVFNLGSARVYEVKREKNITIQGKEAVLIVDENRVQTIIESINEAKSIYLLVTLGG